MYQYSDHDHALVRARVEEFRDQTRRHLAGQLNEDDFRPLRLMNGLYIQRLGPMLRIAIPYGTLSSTQLRALSEVARRYDRGLGHFTTRQNMQLHHLELADVPEVLADLAEVEMHAMQTSGNCIRNVTSDQLAGIAADEVDDPRPWCELIRQWGTLHPEFIYLPRKFKIAVSGARYDRAAVQVHDIGLRLVEGSGHDARFEVWVGGGLGRTPVIAERLRHDLPGREVLPYLEAILRIYNRFGRRDNKNKARIKILVRQLGVARFRELVEAEYATMARDHLLITESRYAEVARHFRRPAVATTAADEAELQATAEGDEAFANWLRWNTERQRQTGVRAVTVCLKHGDRQPGDISSDEMDVVAELADHAGQGEIRSTHHQNLVLPDIPASRLYAVWQTLARLGLAHPVVGTVADTICCPGWKYCNLANAESIPVALAVQEQLEDLDYLHDLGEVRLNISGCMNACGHHHVGHIGILGVEKRGEPWYQIQVGGSSAGEVSLGKVLGPSVAQDQVAPVVASLMERYVALREGEERFIDTVRRVGLAPFKEVLHAAA
ncbi:sulfite reductase (NADPH) hemoprotein beta-component [Alkalispirillum mobile]|uniref:Sulfite reductase (NADPH) hemoprotein beta-component n=1 Tax=Alkalispirillum mobile TaxID=85925 RepID=A0A498C339_9GAMM|nr:nitrite/sulfite reductase [Alkalispirillum mobile]RLK50514.1 sulfite reductase (NADPH) hemoprotein beta-component [Alkalispirillum mobile]